MFGIILQPNIILPTTNNKSVAILDVFENNS